MDPLTSKSIPAEKLRLHQGILIWEVDFPNGTASPFQLQCLVFSYNVCHSITHETMSAHTDHHLDVFGFHVTEN